VADGVAAVGAPRLRWVADVLAPFHVTPEAAVRLVFLLYVGSLACLLLGWRTRLAAVVAWATHLSMNVTGFVSIYGVDEFANIALFYMIWMPVGDCASVDRSAGRRSGAPSPGARLALRVLQIHLCIIYFDSGIRKAALDDAWQGSFADWWSGKAEFRQLWRFKPGDWWNGQAIWDACTLPSNNFDFTWLAWVPWVAVLLGWSTLLIEIGYPILVWPRLTRKAWALATIGLHVGIGVVLGLWTFSAMMIVLTGSAFLVSPEPPPQGAQPAAG
jgi:hypothetical protein